MSITRHRRSSIFMALGALVGTFLIGQPARGAMSVVTGTVSSSNGAIASGQVAFFATCQDYEQSNYAAWDDISGGEYSVNIPDGTYRVGIRPGDGTGAGTSWHNAKASCEQADVVTVNGYTNQPLVSLPGSEVTGTVSSSNGPVTDGVVMLYATCQVLGNLHWQQAIPPAIHYAGAATIIDGRYRVTVPDGTYRVLIQQRNSEHGALRSWHNAKPTCDQADVVTISGNTSQNLVATAGFVVSGTVRSTNGRVSSGYVHFFTTCQEHADQSFEFFGTYRALVFAGTYRVLISPDGDTGARESWYSTKPTCEQADAITVIGNTTQDLLTLPGKQTVKKPPASLKKGKSATLAKTSSARTRVRWTSITKQVCTVKKSDVTALKRGKCVVRASVPKTSAFPAYAKRFTIRVR